MTKSATDVMQDILFAAVIDSIVALKAASKGLPNTLLRDLNAIHANTTLADLPPELQAAIAASVRGAFTRLLKEGYSVSPGREAPQRHGTPPRRPGDEDRPRRGPAPPRRDGPGGRRDGPGGGGRPPRPGGRPGGRSGGGGAKGRG
ncbi:MAG: hypothetical protein ACK4K7_01780 [Allosphingosinicella sp.]|uniref:hypothetical protein n=1 Tax=Allosphingosinicella sp. TaxID=2823234 RepID=UPI003963C51D